MTTNQILAKLATAKFSFYYGNEFESKMSFVEVLSQLANYSDFFQYSADEQKSIANRWLKEKEIYIDCDRGVKIFGI